MFPFLEKKTQNNILQENEGTMFLPCVSPGYYLFQDLFVQSNKSIFEVSTIDTGIIYETCSKS